MPPVNINTPVSYNPPTRLAKIKRVVVRIMIISFIIWAVGSGISLLLPSDIQEVCVAIAGFIGMVGFAILLSLGGIASLCSKKIPPCILGVITILAGSATSLFLFGGSFLFPFEPYIQNYAMAISASVTLICSALCFCVNLFYVPHTTIENIYSAILLVIFIGAAVLCLAGLFNPDPTAHISYGDNLNSIFMGLLALGLAVLASIFAFAAASES